MLYFRTQDDRHILILEPENLEALQSRDFVKSPNNTVILALTPDAEWLQTELIARAGKISPEILEALLKESQTHPEKKGRAYHPYIQVIKDGKLQGKKE